MLFSFSLSLLALSQRPACHRKSRKNRTPDGAASAACIGDRGQAEEHPIANEPFASCRVI